MPYVENFKFDLFNFTLILMKLMWTCLASCGEKERTGGWTSSRTMAAKNQHALISCQWTNTWHNLNFNRLNLVLDVATQRDKNNVK